jgi:hypothetical protein
MKHSLVKTFTALRTLLDREKSTIAARLLEINRVLGYASAPSTAVPTTMGKRRKGMSAEGRAKVAAAQRARWAKLKGVGPVKGGVKEAARPKARRKMSAAGRARIAAAARARWAKVRAAKAKG